MTALLPPPSLQAVIGASVGLQKFLGPTLCNDAATDVDAVADRLIEAASERLHDGVTARDALQTLAERTQERIARQSTLLAQPVRQLADDDAPVSRALVALKQQVEALDPAPLDFSSRWYARLFHALPFVMPPATRYFRQYASASSTLDGIVRSLEQGRDELQRDNITLRADQRTLDMMGAELAQTIAFGNALDEALAARLASRIPPDDARRPWIADQLQFPLRQRLLDLQQQLAVSHQGVLTTDLILKNNDELIRGVGRALNVTVHALQVAVTLAFAMSRQRIALRNIAAVNRSTETLLSRTAAKLQAQGAAIHLETAAAEPDMAALRRAFGDIRAALDDIDRFRANALPGMAHELAELEALTRSVGPQTASSDAPAFVPGA